MNKIFKKAFIASFCLIILSACQPQKYAKEASIMKYGCPQYNSIREKEGIVVSYDSRNKNTNWSYEYLTKENLKGTASRSQFTEDDSIPPEHRVKLSDYKGSGLDRGHMAAAGNHLHSQAAMNASFSLSNITPQFPNFNRKIWKKVETTVRKLLSRRDIQALHVITGSLYLPENTLDGKYVRYKVIGKKNVAVPTHIFKAILAEKEAQQFESYALLVPNKEEVSAENLQQYAVSIEEIENLSGLLLFREADQNGKIAKIDRKKISIPR